MKSVPELFGSMVFGDAAMRERLPKETYKALRKTIQDGKPLDIAVANVVANAMKDWATEKGVTALATTLATAISNGLPSWMVLRKAL